jgi:RNA polymerase sigma-70 factor, ECF subfamily
MSATLTLPQLIQLAQTNDHQAFEQIYGLYRRRVYSLCLRMVGNVEQAEDLTQEAFIQVFRRISSYRGEAAFTTWLHRVTVNAVLMSVRRKKLPMLSLDDWAEPQPDGTPGTDLGDADPRLLGAVERIGLERAIAQLPPGYKIIFILHDIEGYEHNEIAELLGCTVGNSKSQLHKARMRLRQLLVAGQQQPVAA